MIFHSKRRLATLRRHARSALTVALSAVVAVATSVMLVHGGPVRAARSTAGAYGMAGLDGTGVATMQPVNVGVTAALVAVVPGSRDAWAVGRSTAKLAGWSGEASGGQTVFLSYHPGAGWKLEGPPVDAAGRLQNPRLTALSIGRDGTGWAVGDGGAMATLRGRKWVMAAPATARALTSVSIANGSYGFAAGDGPTILRLDGGGWHPESVAVPQGQAWSLNAVAAVAPDDGWVTGSSGGATLVLRRSSGSWSQLTVGEPLFDTTGQRQQNDVIVSSTVAHTVSATADGAWIGGTIAPVNVGSSLGDPSGDATRPFTLYFSAGGGASSFCPDQYSVGSNGKSATNAWCDGPMPLSGFGVVAMQAFPGGDRGEAFAGGLGLFHYRNGAWTREPDAVGYLSSVSLSSPSEGWVGTTGGAVGAAGSVSSVGTLGHWTRSPETGAVARWPEPVTDNTTQLTQPLEAVAVDPTGSGRAIAVGQSGASMLYRPEAKGWDSLVRVSQHALHASAWPTGGTAWVVGGHGTIYSLRGSALVADLASEVLTTASLFGVAFNSKNRGYAVGSNGTILAYDGRRWTRDAASLKLVDADLFSISAAGGEFVAAGADGTVLVTSGGVWKKVDGLEGLLSRGGQLPALYAATGLPDGTALVGGELSTLIRRDGSSATWRVDQEGARVPPEGTVLSLAATGSASGLRVLAGMSYDSLKYAGESPGISTGFLLEGTEQGWRDLDHAARLTTYPTFDASTPGEPIFSIARDGGDFWAVGGTGAGNDDAQGHVQAYATSGLFRVSTAHDPRPPGGRTTPELDRSEHVVRFAFFGASNCGRGLCGPTVGSGTKADVVASQIRDDINAMSKVSGGPSFTLFGGDMRSIGIPEELGEFKNFVDGFRIPFFAAPGPHDLFNGLAPPAAQSPSIIPPNSVVDAGAAGDASFYVDTFKDRSAPWGDGPVRRGFVPVAAMGATGARTHYAFDYAPNGKPLVRIVIVDDSGAQSVNGQNPPEDQNTWLPQVLNDAKSVGVAPIVVLNRPTQNPLDQIKGNYPQADAIQTTAVVGSSALLTSFFHENGVSLVHVEGVASTVPVYTFGGGGAPLEDHPPEPSLGYYHSWQLVTVYLDRHNVLGQNPVAVNSYPVVDTLALHAIDGVRVLGGKTLRFTASGHVPLGGGPNDPLQSRAAVVPLSFESRGVCPPDVFDKNIPKCVSGGPVGPTFEYRSGDSSIGYFAYPDPVVPTRAYLDPATGRPIPDATSGLFCALKAGTTFVSIVSGFHEARMQVTVDPGNGPCGRVAPLAAAPAIRPSPLAVPISPLATPLAQPAAHPPPLFHPVFEAPLPGLIAAPPIPVVAPAPPAAGGYAKKEQKEPVHEESGQNFTPMRHRSHLPIEASYPLALAAALVGLVVAVAVGAWRSSPQILPATIELPNKTRDLL